MVGFFSEPVPSGGGTGDVRRVVCSPDLPLPAASAPPNREDSFRATGLVNPKLEDSYRTAVPQHAVLPVAMLTTPIKEARDDPYQCNVCNKTFAVPARLTRHYRTHTGERPFQCDFCDKKFGVKENLSVHRRIHTKERPYKCEVCARAFEHSGKLHRHMRIHTGERPHACSVCNKTFIQSGQLVIHMRTHTGEKPYVCPVCDKGFTCSKQLKVHSRTHTGEKPYNCDICGKSFGYNHVLKLHQVAHYGQKVYKCTICLDTFTSKKTMEAHIKTHSENNCPQPADHKDSSLATTVFTPHNNPVITTNDSSCTSDKENKDLVCHPSPMEQSYPPATPQQSYYLYPRSDYLVYLQNPNNGGVNPALLAAAAAASACEERPESASPPQAAPPAPYMNYTPADLRSPVTAFFQPKVEEAVSPRLDRGNDIRRRVEAALAAAAAEGDPILTPPNSHSMSPSPSLSPEPVDYTERRVLILPPRKRSKAILKSMELWSLQQEAPPTVRYSSVIQYAGTS